MKRKIGIEVEYPVVDTKSGSALSQEKFRQVWGSLETKGWAPAKDSITGFTTGVSRDVSTDGNVLSSAQVLSTDTGPLFEIAASPEDSIHGLAAQFQGLRQLMVDELSAVGGTALGMGINPGIGCTEKEYYDYRTPRSAYDYAIQNRGWPHWKLLNVAATQEVIDVPFVDVMDAFRSLQRLSGLMIFLCRNAPDIHGQSSKLCVRPGQWKESVKSPLDIFSGDIEKANIPEIELSDWNDYFQLLWGSSPMFMLGTKKDGLFWIPQHPTFGKFLTEAPESGWPAMSLSGQKLEIEPSIDHVNCSDWTYFGLCRPRWKINSGIEVAEVIEAFHGKRMEGLLERQAVKVVLENRCNATGFPGQEFASMALVLGLIENLFETKRLAFRYNYKFWLSMLSLSQEAPLAKAELDGVPVIEFVRELISIATQGLIMRNLGEERYLQPLVEIVNSGKSRAEIIMEKYGCYTGDKESKSLALLSEFAVQ